MTGFPINPPRTRMVDANGVVTPEWYKFFVAFQKKIGGSSDPFDDSALLSALPTWGGDAAGVGIGDLAPPAAPSPVTNDLSPPVHIPPPDDLMYPPFYGA